MEKFGTRLKGETGLFGSYLPYGGSRQRERLQMQDIDAIGASKIDKEVLVLRHWLSDGYNLLSLMRASCVVNRQLTVVGC